MMLPSRSIRWRRWMVFLVGIATALAVVRFKPTLRRLTVKVLVRASTLVRTVQAQSPPPPFAAGRRMTPDAPALHVDAAYQPSACTVTLDAGGNLQGALDAASRGDTICLKPGSRFTGHFVLREKPGNGWIVVRTATPDSSFVPTGDRVQPGDAMRMPTLVTPDTGPAVATESRAHHYRLLGLEITGDFAGTNATLYSLVRLGNGETSDAQLPHDIIIDRCYIHGKPTANVRRDLAMNAASVAVVDSYLAEAHEKESDSQAIIAWNGPGPFLIENNYLEAAGENLMFGGAGPTIKGLIASDIEIRHNYFYKPLRWKDATRPGAGWAVKNLLELKNARRVTINGNVFENSWASYQDGVAILFNGVDGEASTIEDVTFSNNLVRGAVQGLIATAHAEHNQLRPTNTLLVTNNLFTVSEYPFRIFVGVANVTIRHNTLWNGGSLLYADPNPTLSVDTMLFEDNVGMVGPYGFAYLNLDRSPYRNLRVEGNLLIGQSEGGDILRGKFPHNSWAADSRSGGFSDPEHGDFRLSARSSYRKKATDGTDPGADFAALDAATAGVIEGRPGQRR